MRINPIMPVLSLAIAMLVGSALFGVPPVVAQGATSTGASAANIRLRNDITVG